MLAKPSSTVLKSTVVAVVPFTFTRADNTSYALSNLYLHHADFGCMRFLIETKIAIAPTNVSQFKNPFGMF